MPHIPMHTETEPNKSTNFQGSFQGSLFKLSNNLNLGKISRISMIPNRFYLKENASQ